MKEFVNIYGFKFDFNKHAEKPIGPSETVPNESYTVRELYEKFTSGIGPQVAKEGRWDTGASFDSMDLEKLSNSDLFEIEEYKMLLADEMLDQEKTIKEEGKKISEQRKAQLQELEEIRAELKARKEKKEPPEKQDK